MIATLELYQVLTEGLKITNKRGTVKSFMYVVEFGPVAKVCSSERAAIKYLKKMGFMLNEHIEWELKYKSDEQVFLERHYKKFERSQNLSPVK